MQSQVWEPAGEERSEELCLVLDARYWVPGARCSVEGMGVRCRVLHHLVAGSLAGGKAQGSSPLPSHPVASCGCSTRLSKPKCFLISLPHFRDSSWVLATSRMASCTTSASSAQSARCAQAARSSPSWFIVLRGSVLQHRGLPRAEGTLLFWGVIGFLASSECIHLLCRGRGVGAGCNLPTVDFQIRMRA